MLKLGLLGAGRWGRRYIQTIAGLPDLALARVASRNPESAALVPPGCIISPDWRQVATAADLDGVIVATPPGTHAELAIAALRTGHAVLVEKPMTLSTEAAERVAAEAERCARPVMVGHTHLFSGAFRLLKREAAHLGPVRELSTVAGNWGPFRPDVGPLWDWAPHDIAMCLDLLGGEAPRSVDVTRSAGGWRDGGFSDDITLRLGFPGSVEAVIHVGNLMPEKRRWLKVVCDGGWLVYDDLAEHKLTRGKLGREMGQPIPVPSVLPLSTAISEFAALILTRGQHHASLAQAVTCIAVLEQAEELLQADSVTALVEMPDDAPPRI